jgi:hypothetical protein
MSERSRPTTPAIDGSPMAACQTSGPNAMRDEIFETGFDFLGLAERHAGWLEVTAVTH